MTNTTTKCNIAPVWKRYVSSFVLAIGFLLPLTVQAETRITRAVDDSKRVPLPGNVSPRIRGAVDEGPVEASMPLPYVTLLLRPSASQQADLDRLLAQQQNPSSPDYHHWLTPEQYGERFGVSQADIDKLTAWLSQHNLSVKTVARGRTSVAFSGTAGQIESAFAMEIHHFKVGGQIHYSNTVNPTIPEAFQGVVTGVHGLHDFHMTPRLLPRSVHPAGQPRDTYQGFHVLAPADIATIYDITPLYNAGINGNGQKIAIAGQTQLPLTDPQTYRSTFNLPAISPTTMLVPGTQDPGISTGDLQEADLDVEIAGAIARNSTIVFVYSENEDDAFQYIIDQNLAPVLSTSYGACELQTALPEGTFEQTLVLQGNAQGMTVFAPSGDDAALDCVGDGNAPGTFPDEDSLAVDYPGSMPQITSVGGTEFNEGSGTYWSSTNPASALSYIPEIAWNDSSIDNAPSGTGGGASILFDKPWWQTGTGVPADGVRDTPDISIASSADHDGYLIYNDGAQVFGGTSIGPPALAAIATLVGQYQVSNGLQTTAALGQINPVLYSLASVSGVFHDITAGTNAVPPCDIQQGCTAIAIGYNAGPGYDQTTGLGTIDVYNLAKAWHAAAVAKTQAAETLSASVASMAFTDTTVLTATVTAPPSAPTGIVNFSVANSFLGSAPVTNGVATLTISGALLSSGANTISAQYEGDATHTGAAAFATINGTSVDSDSPVIGGVSNSASFTQQFAPGGIISVFGTQLAPATAISSAPVPVMLTGAQVTIDGLAAPIYYASPTQLNIQVPYGIPPGSAATLTVYDNDTEEGASTTINISQVAPAIFTFSGSAPVPYTTAAIGQEIFLFFTGAGALTPAVSTGQTPAAGDVPVPAAGSVTVTVGGVPATVNFSGVPAWSVGAVQVNYTIAAGTPLGAQPVVVSVNGIASAAATLTVTQ